MFDSRGSPVTEYDSKSSSMDRHLLDLTFLHLSLFLCFFSFFFPDPYNPISQDIIPKMTNAHCHMLLFV